MSDLAISAHGLGKFYRIGARQDTYRTLRESITETVSRPFRKVRSPLGSSSVSSNREETMWALRDVSFEVKSGEVLGIIGRNGAGKSTLLKILSRITKPTEGHAEINGRVGSLLEVGTGFHPELTGRENIYLNGAILGMKKTEIKRKFDEIVAFAEVEKFIDTPVKRYSSGMYLRLAFAVAAHLEPEILIVDEVLAVGDAEFQKKCLGKMGDIGREGRTVLFVSHSMPAIARMCGRVLLLKAGELVTDGPAVQVVQRYLAAHLTNRAQWERPEDSRTSPAFRFISAAAKDENGALCSAFRGDQAIHIEMVYEVNLPLAGCQVDAWFSNAMGVQVIATADTDRQNVPAISRVPGRYRTDFVVPGHFLAFGRYTISFSSHLPWVITYDEVLDAITMEVLLVGSFESFDSRKPVVAPLFYWRTDVLDSGCGGQ